MKVFAAVVVRNIYFKSAYLCTVYIILVIYIMYVCVHIYKEMLKRICGCVGFISCYTYFLFHFPIVIIHEKYFLLKNLLHYFIFFFFKIKIYFLNLIFNFVFFVIWTLCLYLYICNCLECVPICKFLGIYVLV